MRGKWWNVKSGGPESGELLLYGEIGDGWWSENQSKGFIEAIRGLGDIKLLTIRINSIGGDVFAGQAIYSFLKSRKFSKTVLVDGLAASIASVVAMAGDKIIVPANAMMMIHNPWSLAAGEAEDMRKEAELLDKVRDQIAGVYVERTGKGLKEVLALMAAETWMTGEEAVSLGFADEIGEPVEAAASVRDGFFSLSTSTGTAKASMERVKAMRTDLTALFPQGKGAGKTEEEGIDPMNLEELKAKYPELYAAAVEEGHAAGVKTGEELERARLQALDELAQPGCEEIIAKAKYETFSTAQDCAIDLLKVQRTQSALNDRREDAKALNSVGGMDPNGMPGEQDRELNSFLSLVKEVAPNARTTARASVRGVA